MILEMRDFLEWGGERLGGDHQVRGYGFGGRGFDTRVCFLLCLPIGRHSSLGHIGPAIFQVAVTLGCEGAAVSG
jgi:hypothetical protein